MSQKPLLPLEKTTHFLADKFNNVSEITLLSGGEWSQAYSFVHNDQKYVLRWCNTSETFEKDAYASRFNSEAMPIPEIIEAGKAYKKEYAISKFVEGKFIDTLSAPELQNTLPALFKLFDELRNADLTNTTGYGGWDKNGKGEYSSWKAYLLSVKKDQDITSISGWFNNLSNCSLGTKSFDQLYSKLEQYVQYCPENRELIHSDLLNFNLLIKNSKISGVIDWQCSLYGDSLYDIAWYLYYTPWYPQFKKVNLSTKALTHFKSFASNTDNIEKRLICYYLHIGLGSIAYNSFKQDWKAATEAAEYTVEILQKHE